MIYIIRDREAGNLIDEFASFEAAHAALTAYEIEDKADGVYTPTFYEIVEVE